LAGRIFMELDNFDPDDPEHGVNRLDKLPLRFKVR
jgi:hypothetical protein